MGDSCSVHPEALERPVPRRDSADKARGYNLSLKGHGDVRIKRRSTGRLFEDFLEGKLEHPYVDFELVFEEECQKLTRSVNR